LHIPKEDRDVSGLGAREVLVVREVVHVHALQVRSLWRTETKKQGVDRSLGVPILISLGAKLAALKTFYGWVALVAIVCIHVDECRASSSGRKKCAAASSLSHHAQLA